MRLFKYSIDVMSLPHLLLCFAVILLLEELNQGYANNLLYDNVLVDLSGSQTQPTFKLICSKQKTIGINSSSKSANPVIRSTHLVWQTFSSFFLLELRA